MEDAAGDLEWIFGFGVGAWESLVYGGDTWERAKGETWGGGE